MTDVEAADRPADAAGRPRIHIIGNSNSITRFSYARFLAGLVEIDIINESIGDSPNVLLHEVIARQHFAGSALITRAWPEREITRSSSPLSRRLVRLDADHGRRPRARRPAPARLLVALGNLDAALSELRDDAGTPGQHPDLSALAEKITAFKQMLNR